MKEGRGEEKRRRGEEPAGGLLGRSCHHPSTRSWVVGSGLVWSGLVWRGVVWCGAEYRSTGAGAG